jgi:two-component system, cell cycle sensor histidine kinase and response regulator CckA
MFALIPLKALILEDNESDYQIMLYELKRAGFDAVCEHVDDEAGFRAKLDRGLDIILADYHLPQFDAMSALGILRERGLDIPFIVVTGSLSEEAAVTCIKSGATDYLLKDRLARLGSAIAQALEARKNVEAKAEAERQIRRRNRELTLLNRIIAASAEGKDETSILQTACQELANVLDLRYAAALVLKEERTAALIVARHSREKDIEDEGLSGTARAALLSGLTSPIVIRDLRADASYPAMREALVPRGIASLALVPILVEGRCEGCLVLGAGEKGRFGEEEIGLAKSVADQLANAMARARLERERGMLSTAIEQATDAVVITDAAGLIRYVNPVFESMTGYPRVEAIGKRADFACSHRSTGNDRGNGWTEAWKGKEWRSRSECDRKDGRPFTVDSTFCPVIDKSGAVSNYVGVLRDVTESLQLEQRYLQSQKMEAVGRLAGGIAHDFNNLLTVIIGYADVLSIAFASDAERKPEVLEIKKAALSAAGLTKQLLAFSRKQVMKPRIVDMNAIVEGMKGMLKPIIGDDIGMETDLDPGIGPVLADPGQIEQIIMNLAVNSRDAMPDGGLLTLSTRNLEADQAYVRDRPGVPPGAYVGLAVADTGTGMSEEAMSHLFEPFFTTKAEGKGTGLGLSTVYGIVKQSGGHIASSSELRKGTRFEMLFPRLEGRAAELSGSPVLEPGGEGSGKIVIAEDETTVREITRRILARIGYEVITTATADEALKLCADRETKVDLLVTDVLMPGIGGIDLAKLVRTSRPEIKVLFISGFTDSDAISAAAAEPNSAFLPKPFTYDELTGAMRSLMEGGE